MRLNRLAACALTALAAVLAACSERKEVDADRPASLTGRWVGRVESGAAAADDDSIALTLAGDASAEVRRWTAASARARFDSTARYALWKFAGSSHDGGATICLHLPATGANDCIPIRARAGDSMRLAFPSRPTAPGAVVDVTLHRVAAADSTPPP